MGFLGVGQQRQEANIRNFLVFTSLLASLTHLEINMTHTVPATGQTTRRTLLAFITSTLLATALPLSAQAQNLPASQLVSQLKAGGLVVFFRHGETGPAYADRDKAVMGDCATQRNLNAEGRAQVAKLGQDFKALQIPVGQVFSSEFCRSWQHAEAMFGKGGYTITDRLSVPLSYPSVNDADRALAAKSLNALLSQAPAAGKNTVLVSHGINVLIATNYHPNLQGEAVIFRPDGKGGYARLGSVLPNEWVAANSKSQ
jgi:phosphohistidine phosphatase SixA